MGISSIIVMVVGVAVLYYMLTREDKSNYSTTNTAKSKNYNDKQTNPDYVYVSELEDLLSKLGLSDKQQISSSLIVSKVTEKAEKDISSSFANMVKQINKDSSADSIIKAAKELVDFYNQSMSKEFKLDFNFKQKSNTKESFISVKSLDVYLQEFSIQHKGDPKATFKAIVDNIYNQSAKRALKKVSVEISSIEKLLADSKPDIDKLRENITSIKQVFS